jgi:predicted transposase/invertase (TIGR01784 family)
MLQDSPSVLAAYEEFKQFSASEEMREKVRARERFLNDQYLDRACAYHKGQREKNIETATNLKRLGVPLATIAEATGLSLSEIEQLN